MYQIELDDDGPRLTPRELQILEKVAEGKASKEIAQDLGIGHRTVERHIENIRCKMRARNKFHMIAKAFKGGALLASGVADDGEDS